MKLIMFNLVPNGFIFLYFWWIGSKPGVSKSTKKNRINFQKTRKINILRKGHGFTEQELRSLSAKEEQRDLLNI